jgi:uncharacterized membrane-anchored protein YitT (DUF2179 family)
MRKWPWKSTLGTTRKVLWNLVLISLGSALCAVSINGILVPREFLSGGFTGAALVIRYLLPALPLGGIYLVLNIPLFALGWKFVGLRFFLYSIAGMLILSGALELINVTLPIQDKLLSVLLAGIITGAGSGIILTFNSIIMITASILFSLERALYTLIYLYVSSYVINLVVTGLSQRKAVHIISPQWEEISGGDNHQRSWRIHGQGGSDLVRGR